MSGTAPVDQAGAAPVAGTVVAPGPDLGGRPARYDRRAPIRPTVSVVVPTFNERDNIAELLDRLHLVLADLDHEIVVVDDDSPDRTWEVAGRVAEVRPRVQIIRRIGRRGLSSAVLEGMAAARGRVLAVIDADLQHDEGRLPELVSAVLDDGADVCVGSREAPGGSYGSFGLHRRLMSWAGATVARRLLGVRISDPMTGYLAVSRERFEAVRGELDPHGFKIGLELVARGPAPVVREVGYGFRPRTRGETKLTGRVVAAFLWSVLTLALARRVSGAFAPYAAVALTALSFRLSALSVLTWLVGGLWPVVLSFGLAVLFEFGLQRRLTFGPGPEHRHSRPTQLLLFGLVSAHSALALRGLLDLLDDHPLPLDGAWGPVTVLGLCTVGIVATVTLSYQVNRRLTWAGFPVRRPPGADRTSGPSPAGPAGTGAPAEVRAVG